MRLNALLLGATALLSLALAAPAPAPIDYAFGDIHNPNLPHLTSATFTPSLSHGMWLVEFFSPYCPHCQQFAPIWQDVLEMQEHLATDSDFHMSRVNCIEQGDLCEAQKVLGYPALRLYADGQMVEQYSGKRTYDDVTAFVVARAADYRKLRASQAPAAAAAPAPAAAAPAAAPAPAPAAAAAAGAAQ
ncbi:thioredoxin-like protein [Tilletiopsis washingtonensis]|uniref:Thioredoxin-like protein n=1 Tax=Tilletiopsis washingtonensis TaxID=58919 RepID=A0A316ZCF5_9BASI|nr:thioredoxin-like protein [Tilletiopsis washingtonensis]PWN98996.1 thioredoxin-like protein [Tilletiopsis washingtonensis]